MPRNYEQPLGPKSDPWLEASKTVGASVLQPQGTTRLNSANNHISLEEDSKLQKGMPPSQYVDFCIGRS